MRGEKEERAEYGEGGMGESLALFARLFAGRILSRCFVNTVAANRAVNPQAAPAATPPTLQALLPAALVAALLGFLLCPRRGLPPTLPQPRELLRDSTGSKVEK